MEACGWQLSSVRPEKAKHMQVHSEQVVMKGGFSQVYLEVIQCLCVISGKSPDVHSKNTTEPSSDQRSMNGAPPLSKQQPPNPTVQVWLWDCEDLHLMPFRAGLCSLVTVTGATTNDSNPVIQSAPQSEIWMRGTPGVVCSNPRGISHSFPRLTDFPRSHSLFALSTSFKFLRPSVDTPLKAEWWEAGSYNQC